MKIRAKKTCSHAGCRAIISGGESFCDIHKKLHPRFSHLKTQNSSFYNNKKWASTSKLYRMYHPICERCKAKGFIVPSKLVHHKIEVQDLIKNGLDPYDPTHFEALCHNCHQSDLTKKNKNIT